MLEAELAAYEREHERLLATARGRWVLVHGGTVVGTYATQMEAVSTGYERFGHVPLLVKQVQAVDVPPTFSRPLPDE